MDISTHGSPVLTDPGPIAKSRLGLHSSLLLYSPTPSSFAATVLSRSYSRKKLIPSKLNDIHAHSWLDSMKASSPPRRTFVRDFDNIKQDGPEVAYQAWTLRYPSALTTFEKFAAAAEGKQLALFLDYDGTLSPIVDDPDRAFMSDEMREVVKEVAKCVPTAIISGRSRNKVFEFVGLPELYYAGSHGMDIMGPPKNGQSVDEVLNCTRSANCIRTTDKQGKEVNLFQPASEFLPMIEEVFTTLQETTRAINGVLVENNKFCVSVHYRNVEEEKWPTVAECVEDVLRNYSRLRLTHGRKVLEIRPTIAWDKGKAVEFLLDSLCLTSSDKVLPIYIGDDRTDEDAFKVLRQSSRGCGILVSTMPKETNAFYSLRDPAEVMEFLKNLVSWKKPAAAAAAN